MEARRKPVPHFWRLQQPKASCLPGPGKISGTYSEGEKSVSYTIAFTGDKSATITYDNGNTEELLPENCMN